MRVGDSLLQKLSSEIAAGDFLFAVISPDSIQSEWCRIELEQAMNEGIEEKQVKLLPVRYRQAPMPPYLRGTLWADADADDIETVARKLATAKDDHLADRTPPEAPREARVAPRRLRRQPEAGPTLEDFDAMAERALDVLARWDECREGALTRGLNDAQRRLSYVVDALPEDIRRALVLVSTIATAEWNDYFRVNSVGVIEVDLREELRSVRKQLELGLPVTRRWRIAADHGAVNAGGRDAEAYLWQVAREGETRRITVYIAGTVVASGNEYLPAQVAEAKRTHGRGAILGLLPLDEPPSEVLVTTAGVAWEGPTVPEQSSESANSRLASFRRDSVEDEELAPSDCRGEVERTWGSFDLHRRQFDDNFTIWLYVRNPGRTSEFSVRFWNVEGVPDDWGREYAVR